MKKIKNIAIIAFDSKKTELIEWSYFNKKFLLPHQLFALGFAVNILEGTLNKRINKGEEIKLSGYRDLCKLIAEDKIDAVIIFGEAGQIFDSKDLKSVLETAIEHNIITATNKTTADFILHSSLLESDYKIDIREKKPVDSKEIVAAATDFQLAKAS
ncbi:MAG TPA: methylglyoxal synthase [Parafilimonas sp.]|nr:methylglyoxal synthase [Parafilimonas sp.]